jgi:hypothetical protein
LRCALLKLLNIYYVIFRATWLVSETFNEWSTGRGFILLRLDPIHQAPLGDHLSELMDVLRTYSKKIKSLTIEINSQVTIANRSRYFLQYIKNFTVRLSPCFHTEDASPLINLIKCMTRLQTLEVQFSSRNSASDTSF